MTETQKLASIKTENRTEEHWNAIYDANALAEAQAILSDPKRLEEARKWAKVLVLERDEKLENMEKVANG